MKDFARLPPEERRDYFVEAANRLGANQTIIEKDFWVCWILARLFADPTVREGLLFKGGTSLSKAFGVIDRFSEDVDLGVTPATLGFADTDLGDSVSRSQRDRSFSALQKRCSHHVENVIHRRLEATLLQVLGVREAGSWLEFVVVNDVPELRFHYPSHGAARSAYITPYVKLEFGSLTDQHPLVEKPVEAMVAKIDGSFADLRTIVRVLDVSRTFWEKATILHAEFHRPPDKVMPDRYARHYSDFAALWRHEAGRGAAKNHGMLLAVAKHKQRFFRTAWANYEGAAAGTLRLSPPEHRVKELERDFAKMQEMFITEPPPLRRILAEIAAAETTINAIEPRR